MESSHWENQLFCHKMSLSLSMSRYRKSRVWLLIGNKTVADETGLLNIKQYFQLSNNDQQTQKRRKKLYFGVCP